MNIKLNIKLSAYTKGIMPDVSNFITDAPNDNKIYGRKNKTWIDIDNELERTTVSLNENSGLNLSQNQNDFKLGIRKWEGNIFDLPSILANDTTYYTYDNTIELYVNGGNAYSDEENTYGYILNGGVSSTSEFNLILKTTDSKGEIL